MHIDNRQHNSHDHELFLLIEGIRAITSSLNLDEVLETIMRNALKVLPSTDVGYLMLFDESLGQLVPKAPIGFSESIYSFRVKPGESITGTVFQDGIGRIFNSTDEIFKEMEQLNISKENFKTITSAAVFPEAAICVPISIGEKRIGVMITHQSKRKKVLNASDLLLLQAFAEQAAIAIQNAQYYEEAQRRIEEANVLSAQLKEKNMQLQKRYEVHKALMNISLENKGVETIIHEFNEMMSRPVSFFNMLDEQFYMLGAPQTAIFEKDALMEMFAAKSKPLHITRDDENGSRIYYIYPIYNGSVFLGCFIVHVEDKISESDRITLEQGNSILSLELIKKQTVMDFFYKKIHEQMQTLLTTTDEAHLQQLAEKFGLNGSTQSFISIFEIAGQTDLQQIEFAVHHLILQIKKALPKTNMMIYGLHNRTYLLATIHERNDFYVIEKKLQNLKVDWETKHLPPFRCGISGIYHGLRFAKKMKEEANKTLHYLAARHINGILKYEDIGLNKLFLTLHPQEIELFVQEIFLPLITGDHAAKNELVDTLIVYFECNRSASKTAAELHIHTNTFYQRIRKIEQLLQIDLNNFEDCLRVQLACHLFSTYSS